MVLNLRAHSRGEPSAIDNKRVTRHVGVGHQEQNRVGEIFRLAEAARRQRGLGGGADGISPVAVQPCVDDAWHQHVHVYGRELNRERSAEADDRAIRGGRQRRVLRRLERPGARHQG